MRAARMGSDITGELIGVRTPIDTNVYKSIYLDTTDVDKFRMKRVAEGTKFPEAQIKTSEQSIDLFKYGLKIKSTYEAIKRMKLDQLRVHLNWVAMQTNVDKGAAIVDTIINGDGNDNGATNFNVNTLDATASGKLTYKAWISFLMEFNPYLCTTIVGNKASLLEILTMQFPSVDPIMLLSQLNGGGAADMSVKLANNLFTNVRLVLQETTPSNVLAAIDKRFAIEEVTEVGTDLIETNKIIDGQFNEMVLSEVNGYAKLYKEATKTLTLGA
jgi:hypothetical protein